MKIILTQRKLCSKNLSKYVTAFNYIGKILIVLNAATGRVCITSHATVVGAPVGIAGAGFIIVFSLATGIIKKLLKIKRKSMIRFLCWLKKNSNSIETLVFQALIDMEKSHKEFITILKQKDKYEKMKENVKNVSQKLEEKQGNMKVDSVNSKKTSL